MWVICLSNRFAWGCDAQIMLELYREHLGRRHLKVGPGSGWYLANTSRPSDSAVTLMDLNPTPLAYTARRLGSTVGGMVRTVTCSILDPIPEAAGTGFDSIGVNFVLHCVPGSFAEKGVAFRYLAQVLADDGVLFGSTILGTAPTPCSAGRCRRCIRGSGRSTTRVTAAPAWPRPWPRCRTVCTHAARARAAVPVASGRDRILRPRDPMRRGRGGRAALVCRDR